MPDIPVVIGLHPGAKGARRLVGTANQITITDSEADGTLTLALSDSLSSTGAPTFAGLTLNAAAGLDLTGTLTDTENTRINSVSTHTYSTAVSQFDTGLTVDMNLTGAGNNTNTVLGVFGILTNNNTATITGVYGGDFEAYNASTGTITSSRGVYGFAVNSGGGTTTNAYGAYAEAKATAGTNTNGHGIYALAQASGGTMTTAYGVRAGALGSTNGYGVYIETIGGTNNWGLYQADAANKNYFAGSVGIGNSVPDHPLDVRGEISIFGSSASLARLRLRGFYTASPADPPTNQTDIILVDNGTTPVLRIRYNDAGAMKVGDVALV